MPSGNHSPGAIRLQVNGRMISGFAGFTDLQVGDDSSFNDIAGGVALGFNDMDKANKLQASIAVNQVSGGEGNLIFLKRLALNSTPITALAFIPEEDQDIIAQGQLIEIQMSEARINDNAGPFKDGDEAGDHNFEMLCTRGSMTAKGGDTLTIAPPTDTGAEL